MPGRPKGPDSGAEVSLGVVRCHLGGPEGLDDSGMKPRQGSLHVALKSVVVRPELGDLNVIIQG